MLSSSVFIVAIVFPVILGFVLFRHTSLRWVAFGFVGSSLASYVLLNLADTISYSELWDKYMQTGDERFRKAYFNDAPRFLVVFFGWIPALIWNTFAFGIAAVGVYFWRLAEESWRWHHRGRQKQDDLSDGGRIRPTLPMQLSPLKKKPRQRQPPFEQ